MHKKINFCNKLKAFSLVEILVAILIVSVLTAVLAPTITKKFVQKKSEGIVYTYRYDNKVTADNVCFRLGSSGSTDTANSNYYSTRDCSKYTFTVPDDVYYVNLTLRAGGGGGGGGGGGLVNEYTAQSSSSGTVVSRDLAAYLLRSLTIDILTGPGATGNVGSTSSPNDSTAGGLGGSSSPAIVNFSLPRSVLRGAGYTNTTLASTPATTLKLERSSTDAYVQMYNSSSNYIKYQVYASSAGSVPTAKCISATSSGTSTYTASQSGFAKVCKVDSSSYLKSVSGQKGIQVLNGGGPINHALMGGDGGNALEGYSGGYGVGGRGNTYDMRYCEVPDSFDDYGYYCTLANSSAKYAYSSYKNDGSGVNGYLREQRQEEDGGSGYAGVTYRLEYPGAAGGGGAAGTFLRVLAFPVTPGDTYTVYVGSGGAGGAGGASLTSPTAGNPGNGGVTTAIANSSGVLVFMVNGGAGGAGGTYGNASYSTNLSRSNTASGRNYAKVFYSSTYADNLYPDGTLMSLTSNSTTKPSTLTSAAVKTLSYTTLSNAPYSTMSANGYSDNKYGGYSNYNSSFKTVNSAYNGLLKQAVFGNDFVYVGGLGGFNGLGKKAGCGGYFYGNYDGRTNASGSTISSSKIGTFAPSSAYNVNDYYDNCSTLTPNGQTADFIAPDPVAGTYGQAGAGGGGGGYGIADGAGAGGKGQDGYLMIDWSR